MSVLLAETLFVDLQERFGLSSAIAGGTFQLSFNTQVLVRVTVNELTVMLEHFNNCDAFSILGLEKWCSIDLSEPDSLERIYDFIRGIKEELSC